MYVRNDISGRSRAPMAPPVNYAGTAFSREKHQDPDQDTEVKIHKAENDVSTKFKVIEQAQELAKPSECESNGDQSNNELDCGSCLETASTQAEKEEQKGILSEILGEKLSLEDILLFASLFLLVFGEIDDEILLLAGVLLLFCG